MKTIITALSLMSIVVGIINFMGLFFIEANDNSSVYLMISMLSILIGLFAMWAVTTHDNSKREKLMTDQEKFAEKTLYAQEMACNCKKEWDELLKRTQN